jgi:hypothetical protein
VIVLLTTMLHRRAATPEGLDRPKVRARRGEPAGWILLAAALAANVVTTALHVSGGGNSFARYALMILPAAACLVASAAVLIAARIAGPSRSRRAAYVLALVPFGATLYGNVTSLWGSAADDASSTLGPSWSLHLAWIGIALATIAFVFWWLRCATEAQPSKPAR